MSKELTVSKATLSNDIHVCMNNALSAAESIHVAMCNFSADHSAQANLCDALHSSLITVEQCRQMWKRHFIDKPLPSQIESDS